MVLNLVPKHVVKPLHSQAKVKGGKLLNIEGNYLHSTSIRSAIELSTEPWHQKRLTISLNTLSWKQTPLLLNKQAQDQAESLKKMYKDIDCSGIYFWVNMHRIWLLCTHSLFCMMNALFHHSMVGQMNTHLVHVTNFMQDSQMQFPIHHYPLWMRFTL